MDRILSARIDDAVYRKICDLSVKLHTSKKSIIEKAISLFDGQSQKEKSTNIFDDTRGIWKRHETPAETTANIKAAFKMSMTRHQK